MPGTKRRRASDGNFPSKRLKPTNVLSDRSEIKQQRESLPIYLGREQLLREIEQHACLVVVGETGSGKTTQIPQFILEESKKNGTMRSLVRGRSIGVTQPRRVAATTVAARVADEVGCGLGTEVGYQVRFDDATSRDTRIKYMTDGILLREAILDPKLSRYSVIVLDEAHERTLHTDILFGLLKGIQKRRPDLRVIIMSATLDAELFSEYFSGAKILYVEGRQYPIETFYTEEAQSDYLDAAVVTVMQLHREEAAGDVLVFLTGRDEIEATTKLLAVKAEEQEEACDLKLVVRPLFAALPQAQQMLAFEPVGEGRRKVILATNIAETSVTISGIRFVVDPGVVKARVYNPRNGLDSLSVVVASKAQARQRAGRAGREAPGKVFRLFTEDFFNTLEDNTVAEIRRSSLSSVVLQLKALGVDDVLGFDYLEAPPRASLVAALQLLYSLGALDDEGNLTDCGRKMAEFPLAPMFSKCIIESQKFGCSPEIVSIVAMLSVENIFFVPSNKREAAASAKRRFHMLEGDHLSLLSVYTAFKAAKTKTWCKDHFVNKRSMKKVEDVRKQIAELCEVHNIPATGTPWKMSPESIEIISKCLTAGCFTNVAILQPDKTYRTMDTQQTVMIHPSSVLFGKKKMPALLFNELVMTSKKYIRDVLVIDALWLPELAPLYYQAAARKSRGEDGATLENAKNRYTFKAASAAASSSNPFNS